MGNKDHGVSEIVGTLLIFAIMVSAFSAFELWYVPNTELAYDQQFQSSSQSALVSLISKVGGPSVSSGQIITQSVPLGIQGSLFMPSVPSSISYSSSGFNASLSYQMGINYKLLDNKVPTAITNKVIGTFPQINGRIPSQALYDPNNGYLYVTDYGSNSISVIDPSTQTLLGQYYAGLNPFGIVFNPNSGYLYISNDQQLFSSITDQGYSTITIFNPLTNTIVETINQNGTNSGLLYPSGMVWASGYIYVCDLNNTTGLYVPQLTVIAPTTNTIVNTIPFASTFTGQFANKTGVPYVSEANIIAFTDPNNYEHLLTTDYYQNAVTGLNLSSSYTNPTPVSNNSFLNHPFGLAYDAMSNAVYVTDSHGLLLKHGIYKPGKNSPRKNPPHNSREGNITMFNLTLNGNINTNGGNKNNVNIDNITCDVSIPAAIAIGPNTESNPNIYVAGYNGTYNETGNFFYSEIAAVNDSLSPNPNKFNITGSFNFNGSSRFMEGPVSLFMDPSLATPSLIATDNLSNNIAIISDLTGKIRASYVWNNPFNFPTSAAYISNNSGEIAVANTVSDNVAIVNTITQNVVSLVDVGINPTSIAYDPADGNLFVANNGSNNVSVIDLNNYHVIQSIHIPNSRPSFVLYDPVYKSMYVIDNNTSSITEINSTTFANTTFSILPPHVFPSAAAIDPLNNNMFVAEYNNSTLAEINLSNMANNPIRYSVGSLPDSVSFDSYDGLIFVANYASNNVSVINPGTSHTSGKVIGSFEVGSGAFPTGLIMDTGNGYLYITNAGFNNITLNNTFTSSTIDSIATGIDPFGGVYDPENGIIYALNRVSNQITEVNGGSIYFNGKSGKLVNGNFAGSGEIVSSGYTAFTTPVTFYVQDNMILTNYSSLKYVTTSANIPVSVVNNSGNLSFSTFMSSLKGQSTSVSGTGTSTVLLNVSKESSSNYYLGKRFTYYDLYGNAYPAMVTGVNLFSFNYTIKSPYSNQIDMILYQKYNGSINGNLNDWRFAEFPFTVILKNNYLTITNNAPVQNIFSTNFEYCSANVLSV